ncbi:class I SAM-dependent methyltransferase [Microbaculum marinisediminis]|uniref:SAM-dependent methyltransferase n=1 Tax=Microbaculum marinisediminis TaxID=2931392 RepID=A0AAW5QY82_9HYPH|nr:SAM-dependent methyltransferase [Microbaculum sp. A6E488]MCT8971950.1 SAM-dependent methyltransferase [Microbaculum sp. A6E488]
MNALEALIRAEIAKAGPLPLERYMALCLGHPEHGYYMAKPAIGAAGDFTTAPEVSQMFGEIVGAVLAHGWQAMGSPAPVRLVELGPGRATLMLDMLRTFKVLPALIEAVDIHLVETSPRLRAAQAYRLNEAGVSATWHDSIDTVPAGPMLLVANEFFDALPIRQRVMRGGEWRDVMVAIGPGDKLAFVDGPAVPAEDIPDGLRDAAEGTVLEDCPAASDIAGRIGARLATDPGLALIVDYGYREPAHGDSLQALRGKTFADPLDAPGEADLTAHVDFAALAKAATATGAAAFGPITQGSFLSALGIGLRAERLRASGAAAQDLTLALERLTGAGAMGTLFKVLALASPGMAPPPPYEDR